MALIVAEFFSIIGVDAAAPTNMAELIPYLLTVVVGVFLVSAVFRLIGGLAALILDGLRK